jgi:hypothetical protein
MLNEHAHPRDSKCKKCKKIFEICQVSINGDGTQKAWRLCFIPCSCGKTHYPAKARAAVPLADHEHKPEHPGYRALDEDEYETTSYHVQDVSSLILQDNRTTGHARADSGDSEDPLAWSKEKYEQKKRDVAELVESLDRTHIGRESQLKWSTWSWSKDRKQWMRVRENSKGDWEYDYQVLWGIGVNFLGTKQLGNTRGPPRIRTATGGMITSCILEVPPWGQRRHQAKARERRQTTTQPVRALKHPSVLNILPRVLLT